MRERVGDPPVPVLGDMQPWWDWLHQNCEHDKHKCPCILWLRDGAGLQLRRRLLGATVLGLPDSGATG